MIDNKLTYKTTRLVIPPPVIVLLFMSLTMTCGNNQSDDVELKSEVMENVHQNEMHVTLNEEEYAMAEIKLGVITQEVLSAYLKVNGVLEAPPQNVVSISAPLGGFVQKTELLQGMKIKKGQLLVQLQHPDYVVLQQDYLSDKSELSYVEQEYNRQNELYKNNLISAKDYQEINAAFESLKAKVAGAEEMLKIIGINPQKLNESSIKGSVNIYSPINGYVAEVNVNIGKYASPTDVMFEIIDTEHLHLELTVYEKDIHKLQLGQKVKFSLPGEAIAQRKAEIYLIGRKINEDRAIRVHAHLIATDGNLLPGMYINASVAIRKDSVAALPESAFIMSGNKYYVYTYLKNESKEGTHLFNMVEVKKGLASNGFSEIITTTQTIDYSTTFVTHGAFSLFSKMNNAEEEEH